MFSEVLYVTVIKLNDNKAMPWLRWLVAGLSLLRPGFDPG
jgi:hypothetical protein